MNKHFELIRKYCKVIATIGDSAIYYIDHGRGYAEINGASFSCNSVAEFIEMVEMFGEDDFSE